MRGGGGISWGIYTICMLYRYAVISRNMRYEGGGGCIMQQQFGEMPKVYGRQGGFDIRGDLISYLLCTAWPIMVGLYYV